MSIFSSIKQGYENLNNSVSYLFIGSKGNTVFQNAIEYVPTYEHETHYIKLRKLKKIYDIQIKRAFGLGFIASLFLKNSSAYQARQDYFQAVNAIQDEYPSSLLTALATSPLYLLTVFLLPLKQRWRASMRPWDDVFNYSGYSAIIGNIFSELPIIHDILTYNDYIPRSGRRFSQNITYFFMFLADVAHYIVNPFRFLRQLMHSITSIESFISKLVLDAKDRAHPIFSPIIFAILFVLVTFGMLIDLPVRALLCTLEVAVDCLWYIALHFTYFPLKFIISAALQTLISYDYTFITTDAHTLSCMNTIREVRENPGEESSFVDKRYSSIPHDKDSTGIRYLSSREERVYSLGYFQKNPPILIAVKNEKLPDYAEYNSTYESQKNCFFQSNGKVTQAVYDAIKPLKSCGKSARNTAAKQAEMYI